MMSKCIASAALLCAVTTGYILGEDEDSPNFLRCWQNGNLMTRCPDGIAWSWNMSTDEKWHEGETYAIQMNMTWSDTFGSNVVFQTAETTNLIPHINIHSCKFDLGKVCVPFIGANGDSVSHTSVITAQNNHASNGLYFSTVSLTEGQWNVIAHGRVYLNDTTRYQLEGEAATCDSNSTAAIALPWKLDFAIGKPHEVLPPIVVDVGGDSTSTTSVAGWQIFIVVLVVLGIVGFAYRLYKRYAKRANDYSENKQSAEDKLKRALMTEAALSMLTMLLASSDWLTDTIALVDLQSLDDLNPLYVALYFGMVIIITLFYFYTAYGGVVDMLAIYNEYHHGLTDVISVESSENRGDSDIESNNNNQPDGIQRGGKINYEYARIRRAITTEKISILMALIEDVPMFVFNALLLFAANVQSTALLVSFIVNAVILGYKTSGLERWFYLTQLKEKVDTMVAAVRLTRSRNNSMSVQKVLLDGQDQEEEYELQRIDTMKSIEALLITQ